MLRLRVSFGPSGSVYLNIKCICNIPDASQVCRLAYEIMQSRRTDASQRFISLDDVYYYGGGIGTVQVAQKDHRPRDAQEIELRAGDVIGIAGNHWNGMSKGTNRRTNQVTNHIHILQFPSVRLSVRLFALNFLLERATKL